MDGNLKEGTSNSGIWREDRRRADWLGCEPWDQQDSAHCRWGTTGATGESFSLHHMERNAAAQLSLDERKQRKGDGKVKGQVENICREGGVPDVKSVGIGHLFSLFIGVAILPARL
ncbi:hypothetical protein Q1695_011590 [Nippostrongylus brasiliensis]|nr:hypothetical protein Q1695_011590 [Nippostrongylus brasiliensis]